MSISVLMTADAVGGVWTYALDVSRALAQRDVRVALAVLGPPPSDTQRADVAELPNVTLYEHHGRLEWMEEPWADVAAAGQWLLTLAETTRADVIHLNGYCHGALAWPAPVVIVGHSCVLSWWEAVRAEPAPHHFDRYAEQVTRGLRNAQVVIAPSAAMLHALQTHYGPLPRGAVIPNGRYAADAMAHPKEPFILSAGRLWDEAKNVAAVCRVASRLRWPVRIAGDTTAPGRDNSNVVDFDTDNVTLLGRLGSDAMSAEMMRASIYVLPARYEPFGLSVLEAAQAGCALVLGDIRSLRESWGDDALYVDPDNPPMLVETVSRLIDDERLRSVMSDRARDRAASFSADRMGDRYCDLYSELMREVRPVLTLGAV